MGVKLNVHRRLAGSQRCGEHFTMTDSNGPFVVDKATKYLKAARIKLYSKCVKLVNNKT